LLLLDFRADVAQIPALGSIDTMKNMRAFLMSILLLTGVCVFSGCATAGYDSYRTPNNSSSLETQQSSSTEDMNPVEKTAYYVGWYSLVALYAWAGANPTLSLPP
jgi:hypothetical protein